MEPDSSKLSEFEAELKSLKQQIPYWDIDKILKILGAVVYLITAGWFFYILFSPGDRGVSEFIASFFLSLYITLFVAGFIVIMFKGLAESILLWIFRLMKIDTLRTKLLRDKIAGLERNIKNEKWTIDFENKYKNSNELISNNKEEILREPTKSIVNKKAESTTNRTFKGNLNRDLSKQSIPEKSLDIEPESTPYTPTTLENIPPITTEESLQNLFATIQKQKSFDEVRITTPVTKTDEEYIESYRMKQAIGYEGELLVLNHEKQILKSKNREDLADKVQHVSKDIGDGLGYDIISYDELGNTKYIEVKTTTKKVAEGFYITEGELKVLKTLNGYHIYRVFDFDLSTKRGLIFKISSIDDFNKYFTTTPTTYKVSPKGQA